MRHYRHLVMLLILSVILAACTAPRLLPAGPTSIPTLIPATLPSSPIGATSEPSFTIQSYPARLPSAELGQPLYDIHCANCHGEDGNGVVPGARNFGDLDYMRGETPAFFYAAITEGRGEMPAFKDILSSDERWDVVMYTWRFSTNAETLALGKQLYDVNCGACHGTDGTGAVLGASDFTDLRLVDDQAPRDSYLIVTQGKGSMPAWQGRLTQDERWAVIDYLRAFSYDPTLPGEAPVTPQPIATPVEIACDPAYLAQSNPFAWDDAEAMTAGQVIYDQACNVCHGPDGSGAFPGTIDFTTPDVNRELLENSGESLCIVAEGLNAMPGWKETLSNEQMWQLLTYMASFGPP